MICFKTEINHFLLHCSIHSLSSLQNIGILFRMILLLVFSFWKVLSGWHLCFCLSSTKASIIYRTNKQITSFSLSVRLLKVTNGVCLRWWIPLISLGNSSHYWWSLKRQTKCFSVNSSKAFRHLIFPSMPEWYSSEHSSEDSSDLPFFILLHKVSKNSTLLSLSATKQPFPSWTEKLVFNIFSTINFFLPSLCIKTIHALCLCAFLSMPHPHLGLFLNITDT